MNRPKPKHRIIGGIEASMENIGASFFVVKLANSILLYYQKNVKHGISQATDYINRTDGNMRIGRRTDYIL